MYRPFVRLLPLLAAAALAPAVAGAQQSTLTVVVSDTAAGLHVPGAVVKAGRASAVTDANGQAVLRDVAPGPVTVEVTRIGYHAAQASTTVAPGAAATLNVPVAIESLVLARLRVTAEQLPRRFALRDFYIRKATWGSGYFLSRRDFDENRTAQFSDFMRRIPGMYVYHDNSGRTRLRLDKSVPSVTDADCPPTFYLDGQRYPAGDDLDKDFQGMNIEGVEVYSGARIPPQFGGRNARCGVIVVWTRDS